MRALAKTLFYLYQALLTMTILLLVFVLVNSVSLVKAVTWVSLCVLFWIVACLMAPLSKVPRLMPAWMWKVSATEDSVIIKNYVFNCSLLMILFLGLGNGALLVVNSTLSLPRPIWVYLGFSGSCAIAFIFLISCVVQYRPFYSVMEFKKDYIVLKNGPAIEMITKFSKIKITKTTSSGRIDLTDPETTIFREKYLKQSMDRTVQQLNLLNVGMIGGEGLSQLSKFYSR